LKYIQDGYKKIDLFVYNAGIVIPKRSSETTPTENLLVLKINYFTPIRMIHALEPQLEGGHLAVVSSMFSLASGGTNYSTYGASKGAIYHYISSLRQ
jgi:short-subunit dehydrogenase